MMKIGEAANRLAKMDVLEPDGVSDRRLSPTATS